MQSSNPYTAYPECRCTLGIEVVKYIECCNVWTIYAKYIIVYIVGKQVSRRFHLWHHFLVQRITYFLRILQQQQQQQQKPICFVTNLYKKCPKKGRFSTTKSEEVNLCCHSKSRSPFSFSVTMFHFQNL